MQRQLAHSAGPLVAATDDMRIVPEQIRPFVTARRFVTLGTDGFGPSDARAAPRGQVEVSRQRIVVAALKALVDDGVLPVQQVVDAIARYAVDTEAGSTPLA